MTNKISKYRKHLYLSLILSTAGVLLATNTFLRFEELSWMFKIRGPLKAPDEIVIVSTKQLADEFGQTSKTGSWSRSSYARLIERLDRCGASVIAFDIAFREPGNSEEDAALAEAIAQSGKVVLNQPLMRDRIPGSEIVYDHLENPLPQLARAAKGLGPWPIHVTPVRMTQFWAFKEVGGATPTLPVAALQVYAFPAIDSLLKLLRHDAFAIDGIPPTAAGITNAQELLRFMQILRHNLRNNREIGARLLKIVEVSGNVEVYGADKRLLTALLKLYDGEDDYYLNFYGTPSAIHTLYLGDILADRNSQPNLKGKAVFVGFVDLSGPAELDAFYTPFRQEDGTDLCGVGIAATAFANLLTGRTLQYHRPLNFAILILFGCMSGALACSYSGIRAIILVIGFGILYFIAAHMIFARRDIWIPVFIPILFQLPVALFLGMFCRYRATKNEKERLRQWVPNKIAEAPDTGHAFAVCLLTDIRGSRALSSRLSAEEYNALMEDYYKRISPPVNRHGGRIWDFSGDGMMCLFAARHEDRDMEQRACMAALEILEAVDLFNRQLNRNIQLNTGIAIHSGWLELGGKTLGDVGNTVSSIEGLNKRLHTNALASHTVVEGFRKSGGTISARQRMGEESGSLLLRRLGAFSLPGKSIPLSIYELMRFHKNDTEKTIRLCELYDAALSVFEEHRRMEAAKQLEEILAAFPDDMPSQCLLFTCREYSRKAPQQGEPAVMLFGEFPDNQRYSNSIDTPGSI